MIAKKIWGYRLHFDLTRLGHSINKFWACIGKFAGSSPKSIYSFFKFIKVEVYANLSLTYFFDK
jgi:hypothetical protein